MLEKGGKTNFGQIYQDPLDDSSLGIPKRFHFLTKGSQHLGFGFWKIRPGGETLLREIPIPGFPWRENRKFQAHFLKRSENLQKPAPIGSLREK